MENVPRARTSSAFAAAGDLLKSAGYTLYENVLDASRYGVPQLRKRFFCFGWLGKDRYTLPFDQYLRDVEASKPMTMKQYLGSEIAIENYYRHPRNYNRRAVFSVEEPSPTIRGVNRPVPPNYVRHRLDTADPREVRPLTSTERSRVQTFPASWSWNDRDGAKRTKGDVELMIGNAVPVRLATAIGKGVLGVAR